MVRIHSLFSITALLAVCSAVIGGDRVQDFTIPSATDDSLIHLSDYSGKVVLVNWWRTSCGFCQREMPRLVRLQKEYGPKGLVIIGVADENTSTVAHVPDFLRQYGVTWPVGLNDQGEFVREIKPLGSGSTPSNYLISRSGDITFLGLLRNPETDWPRIEQAVALALAEAPPAEKAITPRALREAPPLSLPEFQGNAVDLTGKPLLVNFFNNSTGSWAGQVIATLDKEYGPKGLKVIGVNLWDSDSDVQRYIQQYNVTYPILRGEPETQRAWIGSSSAWATFFVTAQGKILKSIVNSDVNGIEEAVFRKYSQYLLNSDTRIAPLELTEWFADDFSRPDANNLGNGWIEKSPQAFALIGGKVVKQSGSTASRDNLCYRPPAENVLDVEVSCELTLSGDVPGYPHIYVRVQTDTVERPAALDGYIFYVKNDNQRAVLGRVRGSDPVTPLISLAIDPPLEPNTTFRLRLSAQGTERVHLNATIERKVGSEWRTIAQGSASDDDAQRITSAGSVGFSGYVNQGYVFDHFRVSLINETSTLDASRDGSGD